MKKAKLKAMRKMAQTFSEENKAPANLIYRRLKEAYKQGKLILKKK